MFALRGFTRLATVLNPGSHRVGDGARHAGSYGLGEPAPAVGRVTRVVHALRQSTPYGATLAQTTYTSCVQVCGGEATITTVQPVPCGVGLLVIRTARSQH